MYRLLISTLVIFAPNWEQQAAAQSEWRLLLDKELSQWEVWIGVPHKSVDVPGQPRSTSEEGRKGTPLGLNNDPKRVFSTIEEDGKPVLSITGEIYGGLTSKEEFENYHLSLQFRWGEEKWEPRLNKQRDSGVLIHCVGKHGAFWNVWMRSLECQVQERDVGDFFALAGTAADIPAIPGEGKWPRPTYTPGASLLDVSNNAKRSENYEKPNGEWNTLEIYTVGDRTIHVVNGKLNMVLLNTRQRKGNGTTPLTKGKIQIQSEAAEIYYRDVKLRSITVFPDAFQASLPE